MDTTRRAHRGAALATLGAVVLGVTACAPPFAACTTVGWVNELTVVLEGDVSDVAAVRLCVEDGCVPSDAPASTPPPQLESVTPGPDTGAGESWLFTTGMSSPEQFSVRVEDGDGAVLTDTPVTAEWAQVGGSDRCGGPGVAVVTVRL
ncbi:hypothetical protein [Microbacterium album]|uniref:Secreted protein n=1 Tax=Microbacterium album TaxID=2053191 RepID=A0A917IFZ7_9MICO|nr:hypothetical protein [Microbacterium album]GGH45812.1 hypothetical protein GCM10010921_21450 [Microbacterium album]